MTTILILLAVTYCLFILFIHRRIMKACNNAEITTATSEVLGIVHDNRPNNLINKDLK